MREDARRRHERRTVACTAANATVAATIATTVGRGGCGASLHLSGHLRPLHLVHAAPAGARTVGPALLAVVAEDRDEVRGVRPQQVVHLVIT